MSKKAVDPPKMLSGALKHNPFAGLERLRGDVSALAAPGTSPAVAPLPRVRPSVPIKLNLRHETKGRSGKVVTRISGLPSEHLDVLATCLSKALGCGSTTEGSDVILLGMLAERASAWLERAGDLRKLAFEHTETKAAQSSREPIDALPSRRESSASPTNRSDIRPGLRVAIVMKADQITGAETEGVVRDLLTSSATHPRGIKVRLESGEVGRVRRVLE